MNEQILFGSPGERVMVSTARIVIGSTTYPVANITSVSKAEQKRDPTFPTLMIVCGIIILLVGVGCMYGGGIFFGAIIFICLVGTMALVIGVLALVDTKTKFVLRLNTASGKHIDALVSSDSKSIDIVQAAINKAIIVRG